MKLKEIRFHENFTRPGANLPVEEMRITGRGEADFDGELTPHGVEVTWDGLVCLIPWERIQFVTYERQQAAQHGLTGSSTTGIEHIDTKRAQQLPAQAVQKRR